jgi:hypothetical protein
MVTQRAQKERGKMPRNIEIRRNLNGKDRLQEFSFLILKISTAFINLPTEKIDDEIEIMFGRVNDFC